MLDKKEHDPVKSPKHYQFSRACYEVKDVIKDRVALLLAAGYDPDVVYDYANSIKYLLRWPDKNGVEDIKKFLECGGCMLEFLENLEFKYSGLNEMEQAHKYLDEL